MIRSRLPSAMLAVLLAFSALGSPEASPEYPRDVTQWVEVRVPSRHSELAEWAVWFYSSNYSKREWRVYLGNGRPCAKLIQLPPRSSEERPAFRTFNEKFGEGYAFQRVTDGWLVAFNRGEWGGALYWYNHDGTESYRVSDDQVVAFFRLPGGFHAIEGCGHMGLNDGSVIRLERSDADGKWSAVRVTKLPDAPDAASVQSDRKTTIAGDDTLLMLDPDGKVRILLREAPWPSLCPNSSILTPDERKLYIGMREYVAEFDFATRKLRMLVPSQAFRNRLPKSDEARIRRIYAPLKRKRQ